MHKLIINTYSAIRFSYEMFSTSNVPSTFQVPAGSVTVSLWRKDQTPTPMLTTSLVVDGSMLDRMMDRSSECSREGNRQKNHVSNEVDIFTFWKVKFKHPWNEVIVWVVLCDPKTKSQEGKLKLCPSCYHVFVKICLSQTNTTRLDYLLNSKHWWIKHIKV